MKSIIPRPRPPSRHDLPRIARRVVLSVCCAGLFGCSLLTVSSCGDVLGSGQPRIRSATLRMNLRSPGAAAQRLAPYALMSALAYANDDDAHCADVANVSKVDQRRFDLALRDGGGESWKEVRDVELAGHCEDALGFYYRVWQRETAGGQEVVMAIRGTSAANDWWHGNAHWLTRWLPGRDQFDEARESSARLIDYFEHGPGKAAHGGVTTFYATGHSLGGGLAQAVFYARPDKYKQVFAFDPSAVTGYRDQDYATRMQGCACGDVAPGEARIYRIYESYELLSYLRFPHKLFLAPTRHVQEIRFGFDSSDNPVRKHSMVPFADQLAALAGRTELRRDEPWFAGKDEGCTEKFIADQRFACAMADSRCGCN